MTRPRTVLALDLAAQGLSAGGHAGRHEPGDGRGLGDQLPQLDLPLRGRPGLMAGPAGPDKIDRRSPPCTDLRLRFSENGSMVAT